MNRLNLKILSILLLGIFLFAIKLPALAQANTTSIYLDASTVKKGFTIASADQNFLIGLPPGALTGPATIDLRQKSVLEQSFDYKKLASTIYEVTIEPAPALIGNYYYLIKNSHDSVNLTQTYGQTSDGNGWQRLSSQRGQADFRGQLSGPHARLAIFEELEPDLQAVTLTNTSSQASIVIDAKTGEIKSKLNEEEIRPIASLTKLMTALIVLEAKPDWSQAVAFEQSDFVGGSSLEVKPGDRITTRDLFISTLLASNNNSARALARSTGMAEDLFVGTMNQKARGLGLANTFFVEPTGLSERNVSTAAEVAKLSLIALKHFEFLEATTLREYTISLLNRPASLKLQNTNKLLDTNLYLTGGKTGYTHEAGYNLMTKAKRGDQEIIAVVLGAELGKHFEEAEILLRAALTN